MREIVAPLYRRSLPCLGRISSALGLKRPTLFCLHSVERHDDFGRLSGRMAITDVFLDELLAHARRRNIEVISLDECLLRLSAKKLDPFICLTFDDGYRDNYEVAYPILLKHRVPATIFLATGLIDRTSPMWWHPLERAVSVSDDFGIRSRRQPLQNSVDRQRTYDKWASRFRALDAAGILHLSDELAASNPNFRTSDAFESVLDWDMVREMAASGLITFGVHTATHPVMARLSEAETIAEVEISRDRYTEMVGSRPKYFAYPFGQSHETGDQAAQIVAQAGFAAAFTTKAATLRASNTQDFFRLPRIMLTERTQNVSTLDAYISGLTELLKCDISFPYESRRQQSRI